MPHRTCTASGRAVRVASFAIIAALLSGACAPRVRSVAFDGLHEPRPVTYPIRIYSTRPPECPYDELGLVHAREAAFAFGTSMETILEALRTRARRMGGDAIVGIAQAVTTESSATPAGGVTLRAADGLSGTVIRFTDPACSRE